MMIISSFLYLITATFVFNLYDINQSGDITANEAQTMLNELYGPSFFAEGSKRRYVIRRTLVHINIFVIVRRDFVHYCN
jgi:stage III sporulation protein SpoIIIAA